jgi:alpha-amylase
VRRALAVVLLALVVGAAGPARAGTIVVLQHQPGDPTRPWTWRLIIDQLPMVRAAGYTAILLSPHQQACGGGLSLGYDPFDFRSFQSAHGSQKELAELIGKAHALGLQVYADMVLNHMCTNNFKYPRFNKPDFHAFGAIRNWNDQWQVENGDLFGLEDLKQESPYVRGELFNFLVKTNSMGFDGYRWDAAKHVPRWYWSDHIVNNTRRWGKSSFGEVVSADRGYLGAYIATGMAVTDYPLYYAIRDNFKFGGNLAALDGAGVAASDGSNAVTFVQNHDTGPPPNRLLAHAFIVAYPGYPAFFNIDLQDAKLNNLIWVQNTLARGPYVNRYKDADTIIFTRGDSLLAGINQRGDWVNKWVATPWVNRRIHDYTGHVQDETTNGDGWVEAWIPPLGYIMMAPLR